MKYFYFVAPVIFFTYFLFTNSCTTPKPQPDKLSIRQLINEQGYRVTVFFDISSSDLNIFSQDALMKAAKLQAISKTSAYLTGHADKTGKKDKNKELSGQRVQAVKTYLMELGIKEENIFIDYFGDEMPLEDSDDPEAYAKNRRVEVVLTSKIDEVLKRPVNVNEPAQSADNAPASDKHISAADSADAEVLEPVNVNEPVQSADNAPASDKHISAADSADAEVLKPVNVNEPAQSADNAPASDKHISAADSAAAEVLKPVNVNEPAQSADNTPASDKHISAADSAAAVVTQQQDVYSENIPPASAEQSVKSYNTNQENSSLLEIEESQYEFFISSATENTAVSSEVAESSAAAGLLFDTKP